MLLTPLFRPFDFKPGFFAELHTLLSAEPVDSLDDFNHLPNGHLACALTEHHNASVQTWSHSLLLFFGLGDHSGYPGTAASSRTRLPNLRQLPGRN